MIDPDPCPHGRIHWVVCSTCAHEREMRAMDRPIPVSMKLYMELKRMLEQDARKDPRK